MGNQIYPELNPRIDGFEPDVCGKPTARAMPLLTAWATELGVPDLWSFYSQSNEEAYALVGEDPPAGIEDTPIVWSDPTLGLTSIRAFLERLRRNVDATIEFADKTDEPRSIVVSRLIEDLESIEVALVRAAEHGSRFRLQLLI